MTISSSSRTAGPFVGTGTVVGYPFSFKVFAASDVKVVHTNTAGVDDAVWVLGSNYTVALNANQNTSPGGTVTPTVALPVGEKVTLSSAVPAVQGTALTSAGSWDPRTVEDALDRATILVQQLSQSAATPGVPSAVAVVPASVAAASAGGGGAVFDATLPVPVANSVITVNSTATGFAATPIASLGGGGLTIVPATFTPTVECQGLPPALYYAQHGELFAVGNLVYFRLFVDFLTVAGGTNLAIVIIPNFPAGYEPAVDNYGVAVAASSNGTVDPSGNTENVVNAILLNLPGVAPVPSIGLSTTTSVACGLPDTIVQIHVSGVFSTV